MDARKIIFILLIIGIFLLGHRIPLAVEKVNQEEMKSQEQRVLEWRKERDAFFKNHQRSPLLPEDNKKFKALK